MSAFLNAVKPSYLTVIRLLFVAIIRELTEIKFNSF
jgi:hypothetical protein